MLHLKPHQQSMLRTLTAWMAIGVMAAGYVTAAAEPAVAPAEPKPAGNQLQITMKDFGNEDGYTLKTVRTQRDYDFTRPRGWQVQPSSKVHVVFQHSPALLAQRSSLNVMLNNRILKTIRLEPGNVTPTTVDIPIPAALLKDHNMLSYQVDQHYTYDCEDPFDASLWTTILPDSVLKLDYKPLPVQPNLAHFPYPLLDDLNNYKKNRIGYTVPDTLSDASLEALSTTLVTMGQHNAWRELDAFHATGITPESMVLVGTPDENPAIASLSGLDTKLSGNKFVDKSGAALPDDAGVLQLVPNPSAPSKAILVVSGNSPKGVAMAAKVLAQNPSNRLLVGRSAVIKEFKPGPEQTFRAWEGFIQHNGDTFGNLGLESATARGITATPIIYKLNRMPDLFLPYKSKIKLHTFYSYASQMMQDQSKLEIRLNGKPLTVKSIPLNNKDGQTNAEAIVEINASEFHTFNELSYQFFLFPEKYDKCRFTTDVHIWGTIHNTSYVELPGEIKSALPDVGLINDGGYPFTAYQDFNQVAVVFPKTANTSDKNILIQSLTRLGRESHSNRGINIQAYHSDSLPGGAKSSSNLIVIGNKERNPLIGELKSKVKLIIEGNEAALKDPDNKIVVVNHTPDQGLVEELISPWNDKRVALLLSGENDTALDRVAKMFSDDKWFAGIGEGNLTVVNDDGPKSLIVMGRGDAQFVQPHDQREGFVMPTWGWIVLGFFAVMGLFSVLRFLFGR